MGESYQGREGESGFIIEVVYIINILRQKRVPN